MDAEQAERDMLAGFHGGAEQLVTCPMCGSQVPPARLPEHEQDESTGAVRVTESLFDPSQHPRADDGEFSAGGGSTSKSTAKSAPAKAAPRGTLGFDGKTGAGYGVKGGDPRVRDLQSALNRLGVKDADGKPLAVDGKFGPKTTAAVKALQKRLGLPPDGKVTPALLAKIKAEAGKAKPAAKAPAKPAAKAAPKPAVKNTTLKAAPKSKMTSAPAKTTTAGHMRAETTELGAAGGPVRDRHAGRVLEALDPAPSGQRRFRVQVIAYGDSKNRRRYPAKVMREAVRLYEGAKAFDHHRTEEELTTGTIRGLVGHYSEVEATAAGIEATLTLLPSAVHAAEVLDAALATPGNAHGAGISHDVRATFRPVTENGQHLAEATQIVDVMSADIVAHPAAGGLALRAVAGGITPDDLAGDGLASETDEESGVTTTEGVLAALQSATPEQLAELLARAAVGPVQETTEPAEEVELSATRTAEGWAKGSAFGSVAVETLAKRAGLDASVVEALLPERFGEADIVAAVETTKKLLAKLERPGLTPNAPTAQVTKEAHDKKVAGLDAMFSGEPGGYRSIKEAFIDITGRAPRAAFDEDFNRVVFRESVGNQYDSAVSRSSESGTTATWDVILGDSITRRMIAEYNRPGLQDWRKIVSNIVSINDFRTQRIDRLGGYGTLPTVAEGAPYQPLTTPSDEEATYTIAKRGGTEDFTLEMIANDDQRAVTRIPQKLGLAAAWTLYRFVFDVLTANAATTYDSVALFHATHSNTTAAALTQANLSVLRRKMRQQASYGDSTDVLSIVPKYLVVPSSLEEIAYQLATSAVAVPSSGNASDLPNLHQGIQPIVVDYYSDQDDWYVICDPSMCPTIEVGFYQGRQTPELFTQSDPTVGAPFNADKTVWKIRHIYGEVVLEHRGMQRGTQ